MKALLHAMAVSYQICSKSYFILHIIKTIRKRKKKRLRCWDVHLCHCQYVITCPKSSCSILLLCFLEEENITKVQYISTKTKYHQEKKQKEVNLLATFAFSSSVLAADMALLCSDIPWVNFFIVVLVRSSTVVNLHQKTKQLYDITHHHVHQIFNHSIQNFQVAQI